MSADKRTFTASNSSAFPRIVTCLILWIPLFGSWWLDAGALSSLCDRLAGPTLLILFALTVTGAGIRLIERAGLRTARKLETLCLAFTLGWAASGLVLLALGTAGLFRTGIILPTAFAASLWLGAGVDGRPAGWQVAASIPVRGLLTICLRRRYRAIPVVLALTVVGVTCLWAAGPVWDWDSEMYHLPSAQFLIEQQGLAVSHENPLMNLPGQAYLWYALGLMCGTDTFAALLMWLATLVTSLMAACLAARRVGMHVAFWTPLVFWSGAIVMSVASTPRVEPMYSLMILAAICLVCPSLLRGDRLDLPTILLAGLCLGTAAGVKYQALIGWVGFAAGYLWCWISHSGRNTSRTLLTGTAIFLVAIAVTSPWWAKNVWAWRNPFYPVFVSTAQRDSGSSDTHLSQSSSFNPRNNRPWHYLITDTIGIFTNPNRYVGPPNQLPNYLFLTLPLLLLCRRQRTVNWLLLIALCYHVVSISLTDCARYLFPIFALLSIAVAHVISEFETRWKLRVFLPGLVSFSLAFAALMPSRIVRLPLLMQCVAGVSDERLLLQDISPGFHDAVDWINTNTPADSVVLLCWDAREYRLQRQTIIDPSKNVWPTLFRNHRETAGQIAEFLQKQSIDYVLVNQGALYFNAFNSQLIPKRIVDEFHEQRERLVGSALLPVTRHHSVTVYRVASPQS